MSKPLDTDVVVIGAGNAALTAALAAREAGAAVTVLERAPEELRGGNTRFTGGIFRFSYPSIDALSELLEDDEDLSDVIVEPYSSDRYTDDLERLSGGRNDPELTRVLVDSSYDTVRWLQSFGVRWEFARTAVEARSNDTGKLGLQLGAAVRTRGKGPALSETLFARALDTGVEILYESEATGFRFSDDGSLSGVEMTRGDEPGVIIACRAAVLGCGGFESNSLLRGRFLGEGWSGVKVRGTRFNTGEMLFAALEAGADRAGDWSECHSTPIGADSPDFGDLVLGAATNRLSYPYGIMINLSGNRFADEGEDFKLYTYAKMGVEIMRQPHGLAIQVFDDKATSLLEERYEHTTPFRSETVAGLADELERAYGQLGLTGASVVETVDTYNAAVQGGAFDPVVLDGLRTSGLLPEKTNWAQTLDEPPFTAYPVTAGITFTFGGLRIGADAAVRRSDGEVMPGVFATGEITGGFFFENYPAGAGLMRGAVFGRIAGQGAAKAASRR